jgi:hypothetical protein
LGGRRNAESRRKGKDAKPVIRKGRIKLNRLSYGYMQQFVLALGVAQA